MSWSWESACLFQTSSAYLTIIASLLHLITVSAVWIFAIRRRAKEHAECLARRIDAEGAKPDCSWTHHVGTVSQFFLIRAIKAGPLVKKPDRLMGLITFSF